MTRASQSLTCLTLVLATLLAGCGGRALEHDGQYMTEGEGTGGDTCAADRCAPAHADAGDSRVVDACADGLCGGDPEPDRPFSLALLPDTQYYAKYRPAIYADQVQWILDNRSTKNIAFVVHVGDITHDNTDGQWQAVSRAHHPLDNYGVPNSVIPGNHDMPKTDLGGRTRDTTLFNSYFGPTRFADQSWYGGNYEGRNDNNYNLFEAGSLEFLVVNLEYAPTKDALCWANDIVASFPKRRAIIATHCYQTSAPAGSSTPGGHQTNCGMRYGLIGSGGDDVWRELVRRHNNIFLVLSGHIYDSEHRVRSGESAGHVVHEILTDYQVELPGGDGERGGNGWLRVLRFVPSDNRVHVSSETVVQPGHDDYESFFPDGIRFYRTDRYSSDPNALDHRYSFDYDLSAPLPPHNEHANGFEPFNDRTVNSNGNRHQLNPAIAVDPSGRSVVVWQDESDGAADEYRIVARAFDPLGCETLHDFTVNTAAGQQLNPAVASDAQGNFVVVWQDDQDETGSYNIHARGYYANGTQRFAEFRVNVDAGGQQRNAKIAMDDAGNFVVVWEDDRNGNDTYQIYARGFDPGGSQRLATWTVNSIAEGQQLRPAIAMNAEGSFVIAWEDDQNENGYYQILARGFDAEGAQRFGDRVINGVAAGQQLRPAVAMDRHANFVVAWQDDQDNDNAYKIYNRGFYADGSERIAQFRVNVEAGGEQRLPDIAMTGSGDYVVVWEDDRGGNDAYQIVARGFHASGAERFDTVTINSGQDGQQLDGAIDVDGAGNFIVTWEDDIDRNGWYELVARGLNARGGAD